MKPCGECRSCLRRPAAARSVATCDVASPTIELGTCGRAWPCTCCVDPDLRSDVHLEETWAENDGGRRDS